MHCITYKYARTHETTHSASTKGTVSVEAHHAREGLAPGAATACQNTVPSGISNVSWNHNRNSGFVTLAALSRGSSCVMLTHSWKQRCHVLCSIRERWWRLCATPIAAYFVEVVDRPPGIID